MCTPFSCGSFKNWTEYDIDELPTPIKTPKRSKSYRSYDSSKRRDRKNPYANQGMDKFSALVAELEAKKQKIYTQKGSEDIALIYFAYTNSDELKPFVVKVKKQHKTTDDGIKNAKDHQDLKRDSIQASPSVDETRVQPKKEERISRNFKTRWSLNWKVARRIFSHFSVTIVLILLLLVFCGRSFAVLCTTVAWYLAPMLSTKIAPAQKTNKATLSRKISLLKKINEER